MTRRQLAERSTGERLQLLQDAIAGLSAGHVRVLPVRLGESDSHPFERLIFTPTETEPR